MRDKNNIEIAVQDLSIGYDSQVLMEHLNFEVRSGEIFCIMGGSGCGKSTLLKHIIGLYNPMRGDILIRDCGTDMTVYAPVQETGMGQDSR